MADFIIPKLNVDALCDIKTGQHWTISDRGNIDITSEQSISFPFRFFSLPIEILEFANVAKKARGFLNTENMDFGIKGQQAEQNLLKRYTILTNRQNRLEKKITALILHLKGFKGTNKLESLVIRQRNYFYPSNKELTDKHVKAFTSKHPYLTRVNFSNCPKITDVGIGYIAKKHLKSFTPPPANYTTQRLQRLFKNSPNLNCVNLRNSCMDDENLKNLGKSLERLTNLNLSGCKLITDQGIFDLVEQRPQLKAINLSKTNITHQALIHIANHCPNLNHISLPREAVTDAGLQALGIKCKHLETICIPGSAISNKGLLHLNNFKQLQILNMAFCRKTTDSGIRKLFETRRKFVRLDISGSSITDETLKIISEKSPCIKKINLTDCQKITPQGVDAFIKKTEKLKFLKQINLTGCKNISADEIKNLTDKYPEITIYQKPTL